MSIAQIIVICLMSQQVSLIQAPADLTAIVVEARDTGGYTEIITTWYRLQHEIMMWATPRHYDEPSENLSDASRLQVGAQALKLDKAVRAYVKAPTPELRKTLQRELTIYRQQVEIVYRPAGLLPDIREKLQSKVDEIHAVIKRIQTALDGKDSQ